MSKNKVKVTVGNATYSLITDQSEEHVYQAAAQVSRMMHDVNALQDSAKAAVLVALQLMSKLLLIEQQQHIALDEQRRLMEKLESIV